MPSAGVTTVHALLSLENTGARIVAAFLFSAPILRIRACDRVRAAAARTRLDRATDEPAAYCPWPGWRTIRVLVIGLVPQHPLAAVLGADIALPVGDGIGHGRTLAPDLTGLRERPELGFSGRVEQGLALSSLGVCLGRILIRRRLRACAHRQHSRHQRRESASQKYRFWNHRHHSLTWIQVRLHSLHSAHTTLAFRTWRTTQRFCLEGPHATHRSTSLTSH